MNDDVFYISTGMETKMYTLRHRYECDGYIEGEKFTYVRDDYIRNLSIDPIKARSTAIKFLDEMYTKGTSKYLTDESLPTLEEIRRRESEEVRIAREAEEAEHRERVNAANAVKFEMIENGLYPFGAFKGERFDTANNGYIMYWLSNIDTGDLVVDALIAALTVAFPELSNLPTPNEEYYGEIKKRVTIPVTCIERFAFDGYYGTVRVVKMVADSGELIVYMGSGSLDIDIGETAKVKGTIKSHENYKGEIQTKINRPLIVE